MILKKRFINALAAMGVATMLVMPFEAAAAEKNLDADSAWIVSETASLTGLTVAEGTSITAPEGYSVTMTVDGIETGIKAGAYKGNIVLTVAKDILIDYSDMGKITTHHIRTAVYVENGKYVAEKSVTAAVAVGKVTDTSANDIKVTSVGENFNGIFVTGDSRYSINNPVIKLTGNGGNDFVGIGAAIVSDGTSDVTVNNASIINHGVIRNALTIRGNSTMHVNDSNIETYDGTMPAKTVGMMSVPWVLGLTGNVRSTNIVAYGTAYYNNSHFKSQKWGVLSTDDTKKVRLTATKCVIETIESGYGSYSIGDCINTFRECTFNINDYALIMANGAASGVITDGTVINSGRFGVMIHADNSGKLTVDKGSVFNTKKSAILIKTAYPTIVVDNAKLNPENGIILQAMVNDDPDMSGDMFGGGAPGAGGPGGAPGAGTQGTAPAAGGMPGAPGPGGMPGGAGGTPAGGMPGAPKANTSAEIKTTFKNMTLNGDIVTSMTSKGGMIVNLEKATITGAITTATAKSLAEVEGKKLSKEIYYYVSEVKNTFCATDDKYGLKVSIDKNSTWVVDETSYLTGLTIAKGAAIKAPKGYSVTMTVEGVGTKIKAGSYEGKIVITVNKIS